MSILTGLGNILGLNGDQGEYYQSKQLNNRGTSALNDIVNANNSGAVKSAGQGLMNGGSLSDALGGLNNNEIGALSTSPVYGRNVAEDQVMADPTMAGLYGSGGQLGSAENEANNLSSQGFKLQPQDYDAYGQASGDIARQFGQTEQSLSSALADRGLAAGGSGAAGAQFSGVQGNKNEQLGQMQMQIANQRMNNTMQRLQQTRSYISSLGSLGEKSVNDAQNQNLAGVNNRENAANNLSNADRSDYGAQTNADIASLQSKNDNKIQNLGDALGNGIFSGVQGGASALVSGGANKAMGSMYGNKATPPAATANAAGGGVGSGWNVMS